MDKTKMIPLVDLKIQYHSIKDEVDTAISKCVEDCNFIKGKIVTEFEDNFAKYLGTEYCIGCGNGTDAIELILRSLNIGPGDEVIVPALTWIATAEAVNNVGAEPVFVDINNRNFTIDVSKIEAKISKKTKAIIPVHLYGCPAEMNEILLISEKNNLFVIEDCAQAHGAEYYGRKIGTFGIASAFSFFPSKNLGAFGDAGAVVTSNDQVRDGVKMLSNHGQLQKRHQHSVIGRNSRLDSIHASILNVKLPYLDNWNNHRIKASLHYENRLKVSDDLILPNTPSNAKHVFHLFVIRSKRRDEIMSCLSLKNISCGIHYPTPLPFLDAYKYKGHTPDEFPVAVQVSNEILSIPIYPEITSDQIDAVCNAILNYS